MDRLYWHGNAAKTRVLADILTKTADRPGAVVLDYGCGDGGDWPSILADNPGLELIAYDPSSRRRARASERLTELHARIIDTDELLSDGASLRADFIVSFSVFEHVYDRHSYLRTARRHLSDGGLFYLNYDDGHFRSALELDRLQDWPAQMRTVLHNHLAGLLAQVGRVDLYQQRVHRLIADEMVNQCDFEIVDEFYSNLTCFKELHKTLPNELHEEFSRLWVEVEERLNRSFRVEGNLERGDTRNLWDVMPSRTLVLKPRT